MISGPSPEQTHEPLRLVVENEMLVYLDGRAKVLQVGDVVTLPVGATLTVPFPADWPMVAGD